MSATKYAGEHRAPTTVREAVLSRWTRRILVPLAATTAVIFGMSSIAFASPVPVVPGDTFSGLVQTHCQSGNWQGVAFPGRDKNLIYAGETIDITCPGAKSANAAPVREPRVAAPVTTSTPHPASSFGWYAPLPGHAPLCNYGQWRGNYSHRGEDIPAGTGTPIHAIHSGTVKIQYDAGGGGNMTIITHDGMAEVYMHQSRYAIKSGHVDGGDVIGYVGATGDASGPHLHLEVQPSGPWKGVTSPTKWLAARGVYIGC